MCVRDHVFMISSRSKPCPGIAFPAENQRLSSEVRRAFSGARCTAQQVWRKNLLLSGTSLPPAERLKSDSCTWRGTGQSPSAAWLPAVCGLESIFCPSSAVFADLEDCFIMSVLKSHIGLINTTFLPIFKCLLNYFQDSNSLKILEVWDFLKGWFIMLLKKNLSNCEPYGDLSVVFLWFFCFFVLSTLLV